MNRNVGLSLVATLMVVLSFQNCGQVQFESVDGQLVTKVDAAGDMAGDTTEVVDGNEGVVNDDGNEVAAGDDSVADVAAPMPDSTSGDSMVSPPTAPVSGDTASSDSSNDTSGDSMMPPTMPDSSGSTSTVADSGAGDEGVSAPTSPGKGKDNQGNANGRDEVCENQGEGNVRDNSGLEYVCIVEGPGKSNKIGFQSSLISQNGTPGDVCMTKQACLSIVSKAFAVKSAEKRGFCKNSNSNVFSMTDAQIQALVAAQTSN